MEYWKFKAIDKLKDYTAQKASTQNLPNEIKRLEYEARSIRSATGDGSPVKGGGNGREERLLSNIVYREECSRLLEQAKLSVQIVDNALAAISDEDRHVLDVVYISGQKGGIRRLAEEYGFAEESSAYRRANKALIAFTVALYGCTES